MSSYVVREEYNDIKSQVPLGYEDTQAYNTHANEHLPGAWSSDPQLGTACQIYMTRESVMGGGEILSLVIVKRETQMVGPFHGDSETVERY